MQDLTLVGLTEDKQRLVLVSDSGEEFTLPADAKLRAALRGDHARLGQLEIQMDSALRPRDIQARIRSGETAEAVAAAAQTTVDRIMGFAAPVLAERAHNAQRAQAASVRRKAGEGPARTLGDAVAEQLRTRNVAPDAVEWDSWRREDGRWTLVADYRAGDRPRHAEFLFDVQGRYVVAENDEARWLVGEQPARKAAPSRPGTDAGADAGTETGRRLSAVQEEELPLGADAIDLVRDDAVEPSDRAAERAAQGPGDRVDDLADEPTVDLTRTAREVRERRGGAEPGSPTGDADWMATQASERVARTRPRAPGGPAAAPEHRSVPTGSAEAGATEAAADAGDPGNGVDEQPGAEEQPPAKKPAKKKGRASVPSWDEIMFGGGKSD